MVEGEAEQLHQQEQCVKRIIKCVLNCPLQLKEEEWSQPAEYLDRPTAAEIDEATGSDEEEVSMDQFLAQRAARARKEGKDVRSKALRCSSGMNSLIVLDVS